MKEKKVLRLTVCKKWFDMIVEGSKKEEYREIKPYWAHRLIEGCDKGLWVSGESKFKPYTHVLFINGYNKNSPQIEKKINEICIGYPIKGLCPDAWLQTRLFFIIKFG